MTIPPPRPAPIPAPVRRPRRRRRALVIITVILAILAAAGLGAGTLYLRRSLPQVAGELTVPGLQEPVTVYRDNYGVPHIFARNRHDLYFAQGYVTAQDRLWQMDLSRRAAAGRLSEIFGARTLDTDKFLRSLLLHRSAEKSLAAYSPEALDILAQYADGVNAYIKEATARGALPPEMALLGYTPEPWQPVHSLGIAKFMAYDLGGNFTTEVWNFQMAQRVGLEKVLELQALYPKDAPTIMRYAAGTDPGVLPAAASADAPAFMRYAAGLDLGPLATAPARDESRGSNNWVLAGSRTASGKPLLANDPHLGLGTPSIWYQTHLEVPGDVSVIGVTFPGAPGIVIGHNRQIAWGVTNLNPDVQDLYLEAANPANPRQFLYDGRWEEATVLVEEIKVKGQEVPVRFEIPVTRHGPVITPVTGSKENRPAAALALRWTAHEATAEVEAFLRINRAKNWQEFREALRLFAAPAQNFVFAATDGDIGYRGNGLVPIRKKGDGKFPAPGWDPAYDWQGYIPWEDLPEVHNPAEGFILTANAKVVDDAYPYYLTDAWAPPYRTMRIREVLSEAKGWTVAEMRKLQTDFANLQARALLPALLPAAEQGLVAMGGSDDTEAAALAALRDWDQVDAADSAGAAIWHVWYRHLQEQIYKDEMGEDLYKRMPTATLVTDRLVLAAAAGQVSAWFDNIDTPEPESFAHVAAMSFRRAAAELRATLGKNPTRWQWGKLHRVPFRHQLGGVPLIGGLFNVKGRPMGGSGVTVGAASFSRTGPGYTVTDGASWRQVVDLADLAANSWDVVAPGQSGHPLSPHYDNQVNLWLQGAQHQQLLDEGQLTGARKLVLLPGG